ncbi:hypothetical protein Tco_1072283 [Tanacetum coccineum]
MRLRSRCRRRWRCKLLQKTMHGSTIKALDHVKKEIAANSESESIVAGTNFQLPRTSSALGGTKIMCQESFSRYYEVVPSESTSSSNTIKNVTLETEKQICFSDAMATNIRIRDVIKRILEIDSDNIEGEILQQVCGQVKFENVKFEILTISTKAYRSSPHLYLPYLPEDHKTFAAMQ